MDTVELQKLAQETRARREAGIALVASSLLLGAFLLIPLAPMPGNHDASVAAVQAATYTFPEISIEGEAAIVYDLATGQVLFEKNADAQLPLASLTKLLTVYAAHKELSNTDPVTIPLEATKVEYPRAFNVDQSFAFNDIARLTLTASLNDGAVAILKAAAEHAGKSESDVLAETSDSLGLSQTFAINGNGLDVNSVVSGGYGSARDVARLAGALVEEAPLIAAATTREYAEAVSLGKTAYRVKNTDPIVATIPNLLLSKTGFTDLAKGNLALVFDSGMHHPIAVVVLGSSQQARFTDVASLVEATLAYFSSTLSS